MRTDWFSTPTLTYSYSCTFTETHKRMIVCVDADDESQNKRTVHKTQLKGR